MTSTNKTIHYLSLSCFFFGLAGILFSAHSSGFKYSEYIFVLSSLLFGLCLLILPWKLRSESFFVPLILFLVAMIKLSGLHIKYGMYLGADSVAEFSLIKDFYIHHDLDLAKNALSEFPLSYIFVYIISSISGVNPINGPWNLTHLLTNALTVIALYLIIKSIFEWQVALVACIAYMYNPAVSIYSLSMTRENFGVLFLAFSLYIMVLQSKRPDPKKVLLYIIFAVSLVLSHYTTAYFSFVIITMIFSFGYILYLLKGKMYYRSFYPLLFIIFLFIWVFYLTAHHQNDVRIAENMLKGITDFLKPDDTIEIASNRETSRILNDFSVVQTLYKLQAFFMALGSVYLLRSIRKFSEPQKVFALTAIICTGLIALSAFVPSLADSLSPTRIMRYGMILSCIGVGCLFFQKHLSSGDSISHVLYRIVSLLVLIIVFVYPINQWVATEYMAFSPEPYPSQLGSEMYNIRSIHEINTLNKLDLITPVNSTLILEFPVMNAQSFILTENLNAKSAELNNELLFNNYDTNSSNTFFFFRKSLFQNRQYLSVSSTNWLSAPTYLFELNNSQFISLNTNIENNNVVYNEGSYILLKMKESNLSSFEKPDKPLPNVN